MKTIQLSVTLDVEALVDMLAQAIEQAESVAKRDAAPNEASWHATFAGQKPLDDHGSHEAGRSRLLGHRRAVERGRTCHYGRPPIRRNDRQANPGSLNLDDGAGVRIRFRNGAFAAA